MKRSFELDAFKTLKKHICLIGIVSLIVGIGIGIYQNSVQKVTYSASATVAINSAKGEESSLDDVKKGKLLVKYYARLAQTNSTLEKAIMLSGEESLTAQELSSELTVTPSESELCINIKIMDGNAERAEKLAAAVAESLKTEAVQYRKEDIVDIIDYSPVSENSKGTDQLLKYSIAGIVGMFFIIWFILYLYDYRTKGKE